MVKSTHCSLDDRVKSDVLTTVCRNTAPIYIPVALKVPFASVFLLVFYFIKISPFIQLFTFATLLHKSFFKIFFFFFFFETGFLCIALAVLELNSVDRAGLELRNPPTFASQVLGLKACATMPGLIFFNLFFFFLNRVTFNPLSCRSLCLNFF